MITTVQPRTPGSQRTRLGAPEVGSGRDLFERLCSPVSFDRVKLLAGVRSFPAPRSPSQETLSGTWGRVRHAHGIQEETHTVEGGSGLGWRDGRTFRLLLGPGVASMESFNACRRERRDDPEKLVRDRDRDIAMIIRRPLFKPWREDVGAAHTQISEWSRRSRSRMVKAFASVDWSGLTRCYCGAFLESCTCGLGAPMPLGMITLTYPGDWLAVAPDGKTAKRQLASFRQRWFRALGFRLDGAWKLEFQRAREYGNSAGQEAPHFHLLAPVPALVQGQKFNAWLSATWADVVGAVGAERVRHEAAGTNVDFGRTAKMSDPKRCAVYFLKHGSKTLDDKEYQHTVPSAWARPGMGPGRFWGFWGMKLATVALDLDLEDWITARRVLRHVARSRAAGVAYARSKGAAEDCNRPGSEVTKGVKVKRANLGPGGRIPRVRKLRTLGVGGQLSGGWVVVNDGPALAGDLARAVNLRRSLAGAIDDWPLPHGRLP